MSDPEPHLKHHPASSDLDPQGKHKMKLSIWFFVGALCLMYGLVLIPVGIYELSHPPAVVLARLHATLWWGLLMTLFGGFYTARFWPGRG